jgi:protein-(glutamine-N5) methyltransferase, release factor-specific
MTRGEIPLGEWLRAASRRLSDAGRDAPRLAAELLAGAVLGLGRTGLVIEASRGLSGDEQARLEALLARRESGEPLAYILGKREFYGREFAVSPATLIPRPETEHLVETALEAFSDTASRVLFADLGTGSGCLAVTLAAERPAWRGLAADLSSPALAMAAANARAHGVADRLLFCRADMHAPLLRPHSLDLLVSNPPYVSHDEYERVSDEVRHEPPSALMPLSLAACSSGGLESLERLITVAGLALKPGGLLLLEHGCTQAEAVRLCLLHNNWRKIRTIRDLAGHDRLTAARKAVA